MVNSTTRGNALLQGFVCTGYAIDPSTIVTAGHCVETRAPHDPGVDVVLGDGDLCGSGRRVRREVRSMRLRRDADLALLRLSRPAPSSISASFDVGASSQGVSHVSWGWGRMGTAGVDPCHASPTLLALDESCGLTHFYCLRSVNPDRMQCVGDSGSPVFPIGENGLPAGIASVTYSCELGGAALYSKIDDRGSRRATAHVG